MKQDIYTFKQTTKYIKKITTSHVINLVVDDDIEYVYIPLTNIDTTSLVISRSDHRDSPDLDKLNVDADADKIWGESKKIYTNDERNRSYFDDLSVQIVLSKTAVVTNTTQKGMLIFAVTKEAEPSE